jgi:peptidyl-tRNA hydrolase, PTH1 family
VCGLGNRGALYKNHRHSIGHYIIEGLRTRLGYAAWERDSRVGGFWSNFDGECVLFKTNEWMNLSGRRVLRAYRKLGREDWGKLCVVYDDLELSVGKVKLRHEGMGK